MGAVESSYEESLEEESLDVNVLKDNENIYDCTKLLGSGGYGHVYECKNNIDNNKYVLKVIDKKLIKGDKIKLVQKEIEILQVLLDNCEEKHVLCYVDSYDNDENFIIVTRKIDNAVDLFTFIDPNNKEKDLSFTKKLKILKDITMACEYISKRGILHLDLKPENILINTDNNEITLIDFGLSCMSTDPNIYNCSSNGYTLGYAPPELILNKELSEKTDIYSLGCVFLFVLFKIPIYNIIIGLYKESTEFRVTMTSQNINYINEQRLVYNTIKNTHLYYLLMEHIINEYRPLLIKENEIKLFDFSIRMMNYNPNIRPKYETIIMFLNRLS